MINRVGKGNKLVVWVGVDNIHNRLLSTVPMRRGLLTGVDPRRVLIDPPM